MRSRLGFIVAFVAIALPAQAHAITGSIKVTGTVGRDDVQAVVDRDFRTTSTVKFTGNLIITPAVSLSSPVRDGVSICQTQNDPVTNRPSHVRCSIESTDSLELGFDLLGGNDSLTVTTRFAPFFLLFVRGGAGNDVITADDDVPVQIEGGDGDDAMSAGVRAARNAVFDGGLGRDLVDYSRHGDAGGVSANLASGQATLVLGSVTRADRLAAIERLSGTRLGDILIGSAGPDELTGAEGPDIIDGREGGDTILGGTGSDRLIPGIGTDVVDGGDGIDEFVSSDGGDTLISRDGFLEGVTCLGGEIVQSDLVDIVRDPTKCASNSVAQAKHRFDTRIVRRPVRVRSQSAFARLRCPAEKTEACAGMLRLRLGNAFGPVLARASYRLSTGRGLTLRLSLSTVEARRVRGRAVTLEASELDADGRPRLIRARLSVLRS